MSGTIHQISDEGSTARGKKEIHTRRFVSNIQDAPAMDWPSVVMIIPLPAEALLLGWWCPPGRLTSNLGAVAEAPRYISMTTSSMVRPGRRVVSVKSRVTVWGGDEFRFGWGVGGRGCCYRWMMMMMARI